MADTEEKKTRELIPVKPGEFGLAVHHYRTFHATIPAGMGKKDLVKAEMWDHVASQLQMYNEIRAIAEDGAWVAHLIVTFRHANKAMVEIINFTELEKVSYEERAGLGKFEVKQRGVKKWCIIDNTDGTVVQELIPTQGEAYKKLDEHLAVLNR